MGLGTFSALLALLFIGLKLTNVIFWSWLWVLSPLWISWTFILVALILIGVMEGAAGLARACRKR